jgi:hypothetical protein
LHSWYQSYCHGGLKKTDLKKKMVDGGYAVGASYEKVMDDPEVKFTDVVGTLNDFKKSTHVSTVRSKYDFNFPRYTKTQTPKENFCQDAKLRKLQEFQKGLITDSEFLSSIGDSKNNIEAQLRLMKASNEVNFNKVACQLLRSGEIDSRRELLGKVFLS